MFLIKFFEHEKIEYKPSYASKLRFEANYLLCKALSKHYVVHCNNYYYPYYLDGKRVIVSLKFPIKFIDECEVYNFDIYFEGNEKYNILDLLCT